jgi:hypothetical protein
MSAWATAAAAVAALILYLAKLWAQHQDSPAKKEKQRHETTQQRRQAAATGDAGYLAADIDRLRERAKRRLSERLKQTCADADRGNGPV